MKQKKILQNTGLVIGILILFLVLSIIPSTGISVEKESYVQLIRSNTLRVGGNGTGNYSCIQDAIDNASNGDMVFVYDDSSPYYEHIVVDIPIDLIGENKNTTVIDGSGWGDVVSITTNFVNLKGFTIQNSGNDVWFDSGIKILSKYSSIQGNCLENNRMGIFLYNSNYMIVSNNKFSNNREGALWIERSKNNIVRNNVIFSCTNLKPAPFGICLDSSSNNTISENKISIYFIDSTFSNPIEYTKRSTILNAYLLGIQLIDFNWLELYGEPKGESVWIFGGSNNTVSGNYLCSGCPLLLVNTSHVIVSENAMVFSIVGVIHLANHDISIINNNFFKNISQKYRRYTIYWDFDLSDDLWDGNYWNRRLLLPKPIFGFKIIKIREKEDISVDVSMGEFRLASCAKT